MLKPASRSYRDDSASNKDQVLQGIKEMYADILVLQEFPMCSWKSTRNCKDAVQLANELNDFGYKFQLELRDQHTLGNVIFSRLPLKNETMIDLGNDRTAGMVTVDVHGTEFTIIGTHLNDSDNGIRLQQAKILRAHIKKLNNGVILLGDFNSTFPEDPIQSLLTVGLKEAFTSIDWQYPWYTHWSGKTIDFIFVRGVPLAGAYVKHTASSDHLPLMVDVQADGAFKEPAKYRKVSVTKMTPIAIKFAVPSNDDSDNESSEKGQKRSLKRKGFESGPGTHSKADDSGFVNSPFAPVYNMPPGQANPFTHPNQGAPMMRRMNQIPNQPFHVNPQAVNISPAQQLAMNQGLRNPMFYQANAMNPIPIQTNMWPNQPMPMNQGMGQMNPAAANQAYQANLLNQQANMLRAQQLAMNQGMGLRNPMSYQGNAMNQVPNQPVYVNPQAANTWPKQQMPGNQGIGPMGNIYAQPRPFNPADVPQPEEYDPGKQRNKKYKQTEPVESLRPEEYDPEKFGLKKDWWK